MYLCMYVCMYRVCMFILFFQMPDQSISLSDINQRSMLEILQQSLLDRPQINREENEVRYKLIIDPSEDNSVMNLLITFGVIKRKKTRIYVCSDFPGDGEIEKVGMVFLMAGRAIPFSVNVYNL